MLNYVACKTLFFTPVIGHEFYKVSSDYWMRSWTLLCWTIECARVRVCACVCVCVCVLAGVQITCLSTNRRDMFVHTPVCVCLPVMYYACHNHHNVVVITITIPVLLNSGSLTQDGAMLGTQPPAVQFRNRPA